MPSLVHYSVTSPYRLGPLERVQASGVGWPALGWGYLSGVTLLLPPSLCPVHLWLGDVRRESCSLTSEFDTPTLRGPEPAGFLFY